jgi:hypothetical protein
LTLDGQPVPFVTQQDDPNDVWFTAPVPLTGGRLYMLDTGGQIVPGLSCMTSRSTASQIPSMALLHNYCSQVTTNVFVALTKAAITINGFNLSVDEIAYLQAHGSDFAGFDLNNVTLAAWKRAVAYVKLRASILTSSTSTLLELFKWASTLTGAPPAPRNIATRIATMTQWKSNQVQALIGTDAFSLTDPSLYRNEMALVQIQRPLSLSITSMQMCPRSSTRRTRWPNSGLRTPTLSRSTSSSARAIPSMTGTSPSTR